MTPKQLWEMLADICASQIGEELHGRYYSSFEYEFTAADAPCVYRKKRRHEEVEIMVGDKPVGVICYRGRGETEPDYGWMARPSVETLKKLRLILMKEKLAG